MEAVRAQAGQETRLDDGTVLIIEPVETLRIDRNPSPTSQHEAWHALAAILLGIGVYHLTNIPEKGSLGHTQVARFDAIVAAAAHAMGCSGGSHDLYMIMLSGQNVGGAINKARGLLSGHKKKMLAIATALDERKKMNGSETLAIVRQVDKETKEGKMVLVKIISPDGKVVKKKKALDKNGHLMLGQADLPREALLKAA